VSDTFAYRSPHNKLRFNASRYHSFKKNCHKNCLWGAWNFPQILAQRKFSDFLAFNMNKSPQNTCFSFFNALSIVKVCSLTIHDSTQHNRKSIITANIRVKGSRPLFLLESLQNKQSSCSFSRDSQLPASTQNSANKINILPTKEPTPLCQLSNVSTRNVYHHVRHYPTLNLYGLVKTTIIYSELLFWWFKTRRFLLRHVFNVRLGAMTKQ